MAMPSPTASLSARSSVGRTAVPPDWTVRSARAGQGLREGLVFWVVALVSVTLSGVHSLPRATPAGGPMGRRLPRPVQVSQLCPAARAGTGPPDSRGPYLQNTVTPGGTCGPWRLQAIDTRTLLLAKNLLDAHPSASWGAPRATPSRAGGDAASWPSVGLSPSSERAMIPTGAARGAHRVFPGKGQNRCTGGSETMSGCSSLPPVLRGGPGSVHPPSGRQPARPVGQSPAPLPKEGLSTPLAHCPPPASSLGAGPQHPCLPYPGPFQAAREVLGSPRPCAPLPPVGNASPFRCPG